MSKESVIFLSQRALSPLNQRFRLAFPEISRAKETAFSRIYRIYGLAKYSEILGNFVPAIFVPFDFPQSISRISVEWFAFRLCLRFQDFLETYPQEIFEPLSVFVLYFYRVWL